MRNFEFSSEKITIRSLFSFWIWYAKASEWRAKNNFPVKVLIFPCSDRSGLKKKCEISNFPRKNHSLLARYFFFEFDTLAISFFEFDTRKQANSERKAIFPIKVLIFLARIVRELKKKCEISNFPRKNHYSLAISFFEFDTRKQANSERKAIFPIKVLIFLARIVRD